MCLSAALWPVRLPKPLDSLSVCAMSVGCCMETVVALVFHLAHVIAQIQ